MKKIFSKILVIFMLIVMLFEVVMPPEMYSKVTYAEDDKPWYETAGKAVINGLLTGVNWLVHQVPGADAIMEEIRKLAEGTIAQDALELLTMDEFIPKKTAWYRPLATSQSDLTGVTDFINNIYNGITDETGGKRSDLFIYYRNESGEKCYPSFKREIEFKFGSSLTSQQVYLTKGTVYYVPRYMWLSEVREGILSDFEALVANLLYSLANGLHFLTSCALGTSITIDDLVFNKYPETNISYFESEAEAGDMGSSLIYGKNGIGGLDNVVNQWYKIFQRIALMGYMAILVYMGIKIMLNSTADQRAGYKRLFVDWVIGIAILLLFPYVMKYMIELNVAFVKMIDANKGFESKENAVIANIDTSNDFSKTSIDDEIKWENGTDYMSNIGYAAYQSEKFALSLAFLIMTWQLITLIFHYYKRLFMVAFLIIIFPLVALSYAVDKIADGKSQAFNTWFKEYFLNVFIQSFHAIIYVFVCTTVYATSSTTAGYDYVLIIVGVTFLFKGEEIIKQIFGQTGSSVKSLSSTAGAVYAKMTLARNALHTAGTYTVGEKSVYRKAARGLTAIKAANARAEAFDVTAKKDEEYDIGQRLPHSPEKPAKDATPEEKKKYRQDRKYFQAAAILNNQKSHSYEEKAKAEKILKDLAMENSDHDVFKDSNMTVGQFRALAKLDMDVQTMVIDGRNRVDIEKNVTARLGMIFPSESEEQINERVNTYLTGLFMAGGTHAVSKEKIQNKVEDTIKAIEELDDSVKFSYKARDKNDAHIKNAIKNEDKFVNEMEDKYIDDDMDEEEKREIKEFARKIAKLKARGNGLYSESDLLDAATYIRENADKNIHTEEMLENEFDTDIDALTHVIAKKMVNDIEHDGSLEGSENSKITAKRARELASEIVKDYEENPREGYFDDEISTHEIIKNMGNQEAIDEIINNAYENNKVITDSINAEISNVAKEILAERKVDILKGAHDTEVLKQEGYTREEVLAMRIGALNDALNDLSPFNSLNGTSLLDLHAKSAIIKSEKERTGITTKKWYERLADKKVFTGTNDFVNERKKERDETANRHFTGDIWDDK